jgi:outer membrane immunogenic protein
MMQRFMEGTMRILLASVAAIAMVTAASAADLPPRPPAPAPVMAPVWNWTGFYIGINGGYSWGRASRDLNFYNPLNNVVIATDSGSGRDMNGGVFGGQAGYNWQTSNWVFGIETDAQWTGQKGSTTVICPLAGCFPTAVVPGAGVSASVTDKLEWFGTFRGRVGMTVTPSVLLYATGGAAYGSLKTDAALAGFTAAGAPVVIAGSANNTKFGWTVGGGIEAMFAPNWSGKLEYLYMDLGSISNSVVLPTAAGFPLGANYTTRVTDHIFRAGINYNFSAGPGPVVARY